MKTLEASGGHLVPVILDQTKPSLSKPKDVLGMVV